MNAPRSQRGFLLILAVIIIMVAAVMAAAIATLTSGGAQSGSQHVTSTQALYLAESGAERATRLVLSPTLSERVTCPNVTGNANVTNTSVGTGVYTVTGTTAVYPAAAATLNGVLNATAAVIPFTSSLFAPNYGMAASGRVLIDREAIDYSAISTSAATCGTAPCLIGAQRGRDGTTAATHATGTRLGQSQCNLVSEGGVPDLNLTASDRAKRTLNQGVQLQEGWAVGQASAATRFTTQNLNAVFCFPGGTECWAVGNAGAIGRWDGASWNTVAVVPATAANLRSVHCVSTTDCWIVGDNSGGEVLLRWTGGPNWTRVGPVAGLPNVNMRSVYCTATNNCWAVGAPWNPPGGATPNQGAIFLWNGLTWTARQDVGAAAAPNTQLNSVHCADANNCWIVGNNSGGEVILRWTGGPNWARVGPIGALPDANLLSVVCVAANDCHATGVNSGGELTLRWTGGLNWARSGPVAGIDNVDFNSVTCVATNDCWAVGNTSGGNYRIIRWAGGPNWADSSLAVAGAQNLNGVSCLNTSDCWAVANQGWLLRWNGTSWSLFGAGTTVLRWNTTAWTNVTGTAVVPAGIAQLNAVSLLSYADGWAVGNPSSGEVILRWTGGPNWARVGPDGAIPDTNLNSVYCVASNDCWIVGNNSGGETILRWTGGPNWTRVGPVAGLPNVNMRSVYCTATNNCWAVGAPWNPPGGATPNQGAIFLWNGLTWTARQDVGAAAAPNTQLNSVHCADANNCWIVGNNSGGEVILRWTGGPNWARVGPIGAIPDTNLTSVYCVANNDCWIVGNQSGGEVILRWTGGPNWARVGPSAALPNVNLQAISCVHASDCWAVGDAGARFHWDGTSWSSVTAPVVTSNLYGLGLIGSRQRPVTAWTELFP